MHEHHAKEKVDFRGLKKLVLVGNPNVGKSVIFTHLTGKYVTVSNYPGTTVEIIQGVGMLEGRKLAVIDTPGINGLLPLSEDERVALEVLLRETPDLVIQVADAKNLRRTLILTLQLLELNIPLILNLNMMDEARQRRINIDTKKLSQILGIPVIPTVAIDGIGIYELKKSILAAWKERQGAQYTEPKYHEYLRIIKEKQKQAREITEQVVKASSRPPAFFEKLGSFIMGPLSGLPLLFLILYLMYKFVGQFAAGTLVNFFTNVVFDGYVNPWATKIVVFLIPIKFAQELLVGEYGLLTMALTYAIGIILPILLAFFILFAFLEDSGYLPRMAVLLNRAFRLIGLSGKAVIPMVLGLGCDTMATLTTRVLESRKERIITTLLLALAVPCSAQLAVVLGMLAAVSAKVALVWGGVIILIFLVVGFLASAVIPGKRSDFILEIPPLRVPKLSNILIKTWARTEWYLTEAIPLFILGTFLLFVLHKLNWLKMVELWTSPIVVNFLNLPAKAAEAFIVGFLRRDYGAAGLFMLQKQGLLDATQVLVSLVTITLFIPCIAQFFMMIKERGLKVAIGIVAFIFPFAFLVGGILNFILRYFKVIL